MPWSKDPWPRFLWRFIPLIALMLLPWPGLARSFSDAFAGICNAFAGVDLGWDSQVHFESQYDREHPWWVLLSVTNVLTGEAFTIPVDTRTIAYIRIAVFLALALAVPIWTTRRGLKALGIGFAVLVAVNALTLVIPLLQVLGMVHVLALGVRAQSALSVGILTLVSYPSMAFAIPALLWIFTMRLAASASETPFWLAKTGTR